MKRRVFVFALAAALVALPATLFAQMMPPFASFMAEKLGTGPYVQAEIGQIGTEMAAQKIGDIEVSALLTLRDRLSVASQKDEYVQRMGLHSYLLPGLGMIETGDTAGGIGFMAADLGVIAGTVIFAYYLLPADLRFDRIDYFNDSATSINNAWSSHSFTEYLPSIAAVVVGMIADQTVRHWSAAITRREAAQQIDEGRVTFEPKLGPGFMGFGVAY